MRSKFQNIQLHERLCEKNKQVTHRSPQPSQLMPRIETGLSRKDLSRASCYIHDIHGRIPTKFLRMAQAQKFPAWTERTERVYNERSLLNLQNSIYSQERD
jgi:hypothetical protein